MRRQILQIVNRVWGVEFRVKGLGFRVSGFRV